MHLDDILPEPPAASQPTQAPPPTTGEVTVEMLREHSYCFLSGPGGTGKTYLARQLAQYPDTLLCATTGIAAVNLGDAVTIHSQLGFHNQQSLFEAYTSTKLHMRLRNLIKMGVRRLVIDEVSMLSADTLTYIVKAIEEVATTASYDADLEEVVAAEREGRRISLILVGDFAQLPPIEEPFAFESEEWPRFEEHTYRLEKVWRQTDQTYIEALMQVRKGRPTEALAILQPRFVPRMDPLFEGTTIVSMNKEVDRLNNVRHGLIHAEPYTWASIRAGEQQKEWVQNIPQVLEVKPGALVMVLANAYDDGDGHGNDRRLVYANGDTGEVVGMYESPPLSEDEIKILQEMNQPIPPPVRGIQVFLKRSLEDVVVLPITREWTEPYKETPEEKDAREAEEKKLGVKIRKPKVRVRGSITYMPLRLAWATTCHKSQGLSLDKVQIAISGTGGWMFEKPGMTYVALSRCRTLEGLTIVGSPRSFMAKCGVEPKVRGWL